MGLKQKLKNNEVTIGSWITLAHPAIAEIMANVGFDWLVVDMEHTSITLREAEDLIRVIDLCNVAPLVRIADAGVEQSVIKRIMDAGAHGIVIPNVRFPEEVKRVKSMMQYPPVGARGVGIARAQKYQRYERDLNEYREWVKERAVIIAQIESLEGITRVQYIADLVDVIFIGPYDLSASVGAFGNLNHPDVIDAIRQVREVCERTGTPFGYHVVSTVYQTAVDKIVNEKFTFVALGSDFLFMKESAENMIDGVRKEIQNG